ncbi:hypothetical protein M3Y99_01369400 [Aphelenchoides fujianensis]|nr:hypothetical protein M3Y99_01369400 [Aphelenchoides fujianensis]
MPLPHSSSAGESTSKPPPPTMPLVAHSVPVSPEDVLITEKSARIRQWVKRRLEELQSQDQRLREQSSRCTEELRGR